MSANEKTEMLWQALVDGTLSEDQAQALLAEWARDSGQLRAAARYYGLHCLLKGQAPADDLCEQVMRRLATETAAADRQLEAAVMGRVRTLTPEGQLATAPRHGRARWLALAAGLALAIAGGLWFYPRLAGAPALGLRLVEIQGAVAVTRAGQSVAAVPGMVLQAGDQVAAKEGGQATLKYAAEETKIELHSAAATFRSEKGAKRVKLDAGLLRCTAAPQRQPFRLETPHAVAEVVGTRFWLDVAASETTLAVQEGKVALHQKAGRLQVNAGETAVADAAGLKKLAPEDAWIRELLARAEAASWEALDLKPGTVLGDSGVWRADLRGEPATRRIWQTDPLASSMVLFDAAKWKRGVIVGRVMMLPEGELPSALAVPAEATATPWKTVSDVRLAGNVPNGVYLGFYWGSKMSIASAMTVKDHPRGVWHRFAVYLDTEVEPKTLVAIALKAWPEDRTVPAAALWARPRKEDFGGIAGNAVGLGLYAKQVPVLWQGVKVVPLGPDLPPPPPGVVGQ